MLKRLGTMKPTLKKQTSHRKPPSPQSQKASESKCTCRMDSFEIPSLSCSKVGSRRSSLSGLLTRLRKGPGQPGFQWLWQQAEVVLGPGPRGFLGQPKVSENFGTVLAPIEAERSNTARVSLVLADPSVNWRECFLAMHVPLDSNSSLNPRTTGHRAPWSAPSHSQVCPCRGNA